MKQQRHRGNHVRHGKVARLPNEIRNLVNTMLNNGASYGAVVRRLAELGYHGFTVFNICRWRKGGYEDWLAAQEKFDLEKLRAESTTEQIKQFKGPSALEDASEILAALNTFRALREIQHRSAHELLDDPSNTFLRLLRIANRQTEERTRRERLEAEKELTEAEFIEQLLANPEKLNRVLAQIRTRCIPTSDPPSSPSPLRGPQIATRSCHSGHPSSGGLGKPLGRGEVFCEGGSAGGGGEVPSSSSSSSSDSPFGDSTLRLNRL